MGQIMDKQCTIRDVAKLAGVSVATASRAMGDSDYPVSPQLRQRVREAAQTLNYVPNTVAKSLRQANCRDIGVIVPNISNPFYLQAILGINEVLSEAGYNMILCNTMHQLDRERKCLRQLTERQVSGIILSSVSDDAQGIAEYAHRGVRFVMLDQKIGGIDCPSIHFDTRAGAKAATKHLIAQGHRRIVFASTPLTRWTRMEMLKGYRDALAAAGIAFDESLVYIYDSDGRQQEQELELTAGRSIATGMMEQGMPATAVLCVNDMLAIGLIQTMRKNGVQVPEDISVVGFDDIPLAEALVPALTTVRYPAEEIGRLTAMVLLDPMINTMTRTPLTMNLTPELVCRDTVRRIG